jgi:hypothetical protein
MLKRRESWCHGCKPVNNDLVGVCFINNVWLNVVKAFLAHISNQVHNVFSPQLENERPNQFDQVSQLKTIMTLSPLS